MQSIGNYNLLDRWKQNEHQSLYMAVKADDESYVTLVNIINKDDLMSDETFSILVRNLTNLVYYENDKHYCLVTNYNEGTPLSTYLNNFRPDENHSITLLKTMLKKMSDYRQLPKEYLNLLVDEDQIIISNDEIEFNEIILLDKLKDHQNFHSSLQKIASELLYDFESDEANAYKAYFESDSFKNEDNLKAIYQQFVAAPHMDSAKESESDKDEPLVAPFMFSSESADLEEYNAELVIDEDKENNDTKDLQDETPEITTPEAFLANDATITIAGENGESVKTFTLSENNTPDTPTYYDVITGEEPPKIKTKRHAMNNDAKFVKRRRIFVAALLLLLLIVGASQLKSPAQTSDAKDYTLNFDLSQKDDKWQFINSDNSTYNPDILKYIWTVVKDDQIVLSKTTDNLDYKPVEDGEYIVTMTAVDKAGKTNKSISKVVTKTNNSISLSSPSAAQKNNTASIIKSNVDHIANAIYVSANQSTETKIIMGSTSDESQTNTTENESSTLDNTAAGDIITDKKNIKITNASNRITKPSAAFYEIKDLPNKKVAVGDTLSMWIKTLNNERVQIKIEGYNDDTKILDQTVNFTPKVDDFDMFLYAFSDKDIDHVKISLKSDSNYVWYDGITVQQIK